MREISNIRRKNCKSCINVRTVGKKRTERRKFSGVITTQAFFPIDFHSIYGSEQFPLFALEFVCCHDRRKVNHSTPPFTVISATARLPCVSRGFSLLAFTKSFAWLVYRVVGLFTPREKL